MWVVRECRVGVARLELEVGGDEHRPWRNLPPAVLPWSARTDDISFVFGAHRLCDDLSTDL
jgi:hypothetical protein